MEFVYLRSSSVANSDLPANRLRQFCVHFESSLSNTFPVSALFIISSLGSIALAKVFKILLFCK